MARRRENLTAYLRICVSGRQQNHKKIEKIQERIIRYRPKKKVPAGSNAYLRICYFLKKSQPNTLLLCTFLFCIFLLYRTDPQVEVQIRI